MPVCCMQHSQPSGWGDTYGALSNQRNRAPREKGQMVTQDYEKMQVDYEVEREASNLIVVSSETTAVTISYLIWAVLAHPEARVAHNR
jgi:cytochrome P450